MDFNSQEKPSFLGGGLSTKDDLFGGFVFEETKKQEPKENERLFIRTEKQVDTKTIIRRRILLTPAVCDICGFDVVAKAIEQNKLPQTTYDKLPDEIKIIMQGAVAKHKQQEHTTAESLIVAESQLARKWLSAETKG